MRVISGKARGKKLLSPSNDDIRPTLDRVKENIYNILGFKIRDAIVLDLFSGTGGLGIEALSRGAEKVYFVDKDKASYQLTNKNISLANLDENAITLNLDAESAIVKFHKDNIKFDYIFMDPPYNKGIIEKMLQQLEKYNIIQDGGLIIVETDREEVLPEKSGKLILEKIKLYSSTKVSFYGVENE